MKIKLNKAQWQHIGKTAGWMKTAQASTGLNTGSRSLKKKAGGWGRFSEDVADVIEARIMIDSRKGMDANAIFNDIKLDSDINDIMRTEDMSDSELRQLIEEGMRIYQVVNRPTGLNTRET